MSVQTKYFRTIDIPTDGNCLFRSIVIFLNEHLVRCRRTRYGLPSNKHYAEYENNCTQFLRKTIVRMIRARKRRYSSREYFDNDRYSSIDERIEKMSKDGEFGGKLEMDIISRMYKLNINVFIPFNGDYSCIYNSTSENSTIDLQSVFDDHDSNLNDSENENELEYSEGKYCFLLLNENKYTILEPNYLEIRKDFKLEDDINSDLSESTDTVEENITIQITDKRYLTNFKSSSELSESSILSSSHSTTASLNFDEYGFEKIECTTENTKSGKDNKYNDKFNLFLEEHKNALLIHSENGSKFLELKEHYKNLSFNDVIDIINSIEEWN
jgi:hypothetical protein